MPTLRANFSQLLAPGFMEIILDELPQHPEEYSQFLQVSNSTRAYEQDQILAGFGQARLKNEGEQITYDDPSQGGSVRYIMDTYALAWQVTEEMMEDDQSGKMRTLPRDLIKGCRETWEQVGANVLVNGFGSIITHDGLSLFNTAHALGGGGTQSNRLNPDAQLSVTALQNLMILFENLTNERGLKIRVSPDKLWIPPDLQFTAAKVLQSQFDPDSANNAINPVQGRLEPCVLHFLTDTDNWHVSSSSYNKLKFFWRKQPELKSWDDNETNSSKFSIHFRIAAGATDYIGWAGSAP